MNALQRLRWLLSLAVLIVPLLRIAPVSAQPVEFKVGISDPVNTVLAIWMADAAGLYAANGIKAEIINMNGGSRGAAELAAGRIDAKAALDRVIARVVDKQVGPGATPAVREAVRAALESAVADDPLIAEKIKALGS